MEFGCQWNSAARSYLNISGSITGVSMRAAPYVGPTPTPVGL